jgi:hypothetical protein
MGDLALARGDAEQAVGCYHRALSLGLELDDKDGAIPPGWLGLVAALRNDAAEAGRLWIVVTTSEDRFGPRL